MELIKLFLLRLSQIVHRQDCVLVPSVFESHEDVFFCWHVVSNSVVEDIFRNRISLGCLPSQLESTNFRRVV